MLGFATIIELFANPRPDLLSNFGRVDGRLHPAMNGENELQLPQIGFDCRLHVRILQLASKLLAAMGAGAMDLAERGGSSGLMVKACKFFLPIKTELRRHAPLDEAPT